MAVVIARDIAEYLAASGEGILATDIFYDTQPEEPDDVTTVYDAGGPSPEEPPESWRELIVQVRRKVHGEGYEKIWRILNLLLYPDGGAIVIGSNHYMANLQEIPSIFDRDQNYRYLFTFRIFILNVSDATAIDPWVDALSNWTASILGSNWTVYAGFPGNDRPSVFWRVIGLQVNERGFSGFEVQKRFTGHVRGRAPNEQAAGTLAIVEGLGKAIKIALDVIDRKYLRISNVSANGQGPALTSGQVSVTLSRITERPTSEAPLIAGVNYTESIE